MQNPFVQQSPFVQQPIFPVKNYNYQKDYLHLVDRILINLEIVMQKNETTKENNKILEKKFGKVNKSYYYLLLEYSDDLEKDINYGGKIILEKDIHTPFIFKNKYFPVISSEILIFSKIIEDNLNKVIFTEIRFPLIFEVLRREKIFFKEAIRSFFLYSVKIENPDNKSIDFLTDKIEKDTEKYNHIIERHRQEMEGYRAALLLDGLDEEEIEKNVNYFFPFPMLDITNNHKGVVEIKKSELPKSSDIISRKVIDKLDRHFDIYSTGEIIVHINPETVRVISFFPGLVKEVRGVFYSRGFYMIVKVQLKSYFLNVTNEGEIIGGYLLPHKYYSLIESEDRAILIDDSWHDSFGLVIIYPDMQVEIYSIFLDPSENVSKFALFHMIAIGYTEVIISETGDEYNKSIYLSFYNKRLYSHPLSLKLPN